MNNIIMLCFKINCGPQKDLSNSKDVYKDVLKWIWATVNDGWLEINHISNMSLNI